MKISACLIVKNEAEVLALTLPALASGVDEIIVVDTGSTDGTIAAAERCGAKVSRFTWINDFAAARNESLRHATGDWIIWIDADELMTEADLQSLRRTIEGGTADAYAVTIYESSYGQREKKFNYQRVKAFRNGLGCHFFRPINEQLVNADGSIVTGEPAPAAIYHWGKYREAERLQAKRERYAELYAAEIARHPNDPYFHFLLAQVLEDLGRKNEAIEHFCRARALTKDANVVRQSMERLAQLYLKSGLFKEAQVEVRELLAAYPDNIPARNVMASILILAKRPDDALALLAEVTRGEAAGPVENPYQRYSLPYILMSQAYQSKGDQAKAAECLERSRELYPFAGGSK